ncbi:DUF1345 domain-containing protein [Metallococcus carri]|uniref:DUF1345 domain-containing protein n=1 Tax=Metallococcus carri TaxID=1656884 RepID=UPI001A9ED5EE|nr:DUF1345 domain-containing protein [Metallococcus carri]
MPPSPRVWLPERRRSGAGILAAGLTALALITVRGPFTAMTAADISVVALLVHLVVYLAITLLAFSAATESEIRAWAERDSRGTVLQRYVLGTAPGPGASLFIATVALIVAVLWLPANNSPALQGHPRVAVGVALVAIAWLSVLVSFAVTFHADNILEDGTALAFPDDARPRWADYIYFAVSVMTTFGTTDVTVQSTDMRQTVSFNAVIAFVFNTVTVAALVSAVSG